MPYGAAVTVYSSAQATEKHLYYHFSRTLGKRCHPPY